MLVTFGNKIIETNTITQVTSTIVGTGPNYSTVVHFGLPQTDNYATASLTDPNQAWFLAFKALATQI